MHPNLGENAAIPGPSPPYISYQELFLPSICSVFCSKPKVLHQVADFWGVTPKFGTPQIKKQINQPQSIATVCSSGFLQNNPLTRSLSLAACLLLPFLPTEQHCCQFSVNCQPYLNCQLLQSKTLLSHLSLNCCENQRGCITTTATNAVLKAYVLIRLLKTRSIVTVIIVECIYIFIKPFIQRF